MSPHVVAAGLALRLVLVWGSNFSLQKALLAELAPQGVLFARYLATRLRVPRPSRPRR